MRIAVVGGTGFLGQHVVAALARRGHAATVLARRAAPATGDRQVVAGDVGTLDEDGWAAILTGHDGVVFAAGADDRTVPRAPAAAYFHRANVEPVARLVAAARRVGCTRAVVLGSYFTYADRQRPDLRLAARNPYVRSRVEQAEAAWRAGGADLPVAVLEIPFVFGAAPGRRPLFAPVMPWLRSRAPLVAPPGGTAAVSAGLIGDAAVAALERAAGGWFPLAEENLTWAQLLSRLAVAAGRPAPVRVRRLPPALLRAALRGSGWGYRLRRREPGLAPAHLAAVLTGEVFVDPAMCQRDLGVTPGDLDDALRETVAACRPGR